MISVDITVMSEVMGFNVPMHINELGNLNNIIDQLKQTSQIYTNYCLQTYASTSIAADTNADVTSMLKLKKKKKDIR